ESRGSSSSCADGADRKAASISYRSHHMAPETAVTTLTATQPQGTCLSVRRTWRSPAGASNASHGRVHCEVMLLLSLKKSPKTPGGVFHPDLAHGTFVRDVVHCAGPEPFKAALIDHRVPEHLSIVHHRPDDATTGRFGKQVGTFIDYMHGVTCGEAIITQG